ncbi:MAG TPA: GtrA family protein [Solirubrobacteraceae bacterium]|jgi:dolichol-phosphate mannosyltransferase|nr:GtrA family protein [Solirubrobacteraceae bacterium]
MPEEATAVALRPHVRLLHGMRRPANWLQLVRFGLVGAVGFAVNLAVYALFVHSVGVDYHVAAVVAWLVAVLNNFVLNRHWTFDARGGPAHFQALRFIAVSLVAFGCSLLLLTLLVEGAHMAKVPAQALAVGASTPLNFLGNKLWSFRAGLGSAAR